MSLQEITRRESPLKKSIKFPLCKKKLFLNLYYIFYENIMNQYLGLSRNSYEIFIISVS
jgi:hypothetical protein